MERTFICPAIHPTDKPNDEKKLLECKGLVIRRKSECKELIIDIPLSLDTLEASRCPDRYCIYRVPKRLREVNNMAYTPRLVSIGPFHHRSEELKDMDIQKLLILKNFCNRTGKSIENLKDIIGPKEEEIRSCYSETILLSSEWFLNMILLDAIFILELFCWKYEKLMAHEKDSGSSKAHKEDSENSKAHYQIDYILSRPCIERGIQHDLLLLENQLPFFVLEQLYRNGDPKTKEQTDLLELSCGFFGDLYHGWKPKSKKSCGHVNQCFTYLVGCCLPSTRRPKSKLTRKNCFTRPKPKATAFHRFEPNEENKKEGPKPNQKQEGPKEIKLNKRTSKHLYGTATKLDGTGLKFIKPDSERDLLQIKFPDNICLGYLPFFNLSWLLACLPCLKSDYLERRVQRCLEVPPLLLDDRTEGLFRNLMALEQCCYPSDTYICDYIVLLDDLITTKEDVRLLVEKEIIVNELGSSAAVTKLINNLALEIEESGTHYAKLCEDLNTYYKSFWNRLVGILTKTYFSDFFKGTATVVGIILLVFTLWNFQRLVKLSARKYYI